MNRCESITLIGSVVAASPLLWPRTLRAQLQPKMLRVGSVGMQP
jgi:hypothetical protein